LIHASFRINRSEIDIARSSIVYVCSADLFDRTITPREIMNKQELIEAAAAASGNSKAAVADSIKALSNAAMCRPAGARVDSGGCSPCLQARKRISTRQESRCGGRQIPGDIVAGQYNRNS
jgi:hypothetical protein